MSVAFFLLAMVPGAPPAPVADVAFPSASPLTSSSFAFRPESWSPTRRSSRASAAAVGVSKRFSRDDLLTAILQPPKDVSPRYRPTRIATTDGKSYIGMIVYEATSGVVIQTGPDAVVRIAGEQIETQKLLETSLMPAGLLDQLTDREIAD